MKLMTCKMLTLSAMEILQQLRMLSRERSESTRNCSISLHLEDACGCLFSAKSRTMRCTISSKPSLEEAEEEVFSRIMRFISLTEVNLQRKNNSRIRKSWMLAMLR